jgi:hypothetical protein
MNKVNTKLAMLASMAVALQRLPDSARDVVNQPKLVKPEPQKWIPPKERKPNTNGLNRKVRRRLASMAAHGKLGPAKK